MRAVEGAEPPIAGATMDRRRPAVMKPARSLLDASFRYVPAAATSVSDTWSRHGWRPTTKEERGRRRAAARVSAAAEPKLDTRLLAGG